MNSIDYVDIFNKISTFSIDVFDPTSSYAVFWSTLRTIFGVLSTFFVFVISYCVIRLFEIRKREHEHLHHEMEEYARIHQEKEEKTKNAPRNERWGVVMDHLNSTNEGEWKLAIIEADSMLEAMMDQLGFKGVGLGEKLKATDQSKFPSLTKAWEVHTIRNKIAHEGSAFVVSEHEAKRVIAIYQQIFSDFGFI